MHQSNLFLLSLVLFTQFLIHTQTVLAQQCRCPGCRNSIQFTSNGQYQVIDSQLCSDSTRVSGFSFFYLQTSSVDSTFIYYLVDEMNYNLALEGKSFESVQSSSSDINCIQEDSDLRLNEPNVKIYLLVKSNNGTLLSYYTSTYCFSAPATSVQVSLDQFGEKSRIYTDEDLTVSFSFKNQFSKVDSFQSGSLSTDDYLTRIKAGEGKSILKFSAPGKRVLPYMYKPDSRIENPNNITMVNVDLNLIQMANKMEIEIPTTNSITPYDRFSLPYKVYDSDNIISPTLYTSRFKVRVTNVKDGSSFKFLTCEFPDSDTPSTGEGQLDCLSQAYGNFSIEISFWRGKSRTYDKLSTFNLEITNPNQPINPSNSSSFTAIEISAMVVSGIALLISIISVIGFAIVLKRSKQFGYSPMN